MEQIHGSANIAQARKMDHIPSFVCEGLVLGRLQPDIFFSPYKWAYHAYGMVRNIFKVKISSRKCLESKDVVEICSHQEAQRLSRAYSLCQADWPENRCGQLSGGRGAGSASE